MNSETKSMKDRNNLQRLKLQGKKNRIYEGEELNKRDKD